jgi:hypothetical protein
METRNKAALVAAKPIDHSSQIFDLQKNLLREYTKLSRVPESVDLKTLDGQNFIRYIIACLNTELAETYEQYYTNYSLSQDPLFKHENYPDLLFAFNKEIGDVIHFAIELLIFSKIEYKELETFVEHKAISQGYSAPRDEDPFRLAHKLCLDELVSHGIIQSLPRRPVYTNADLMFLGGRVLAPEIISESERLLWHVTCAMNLAGNTLKLKNWSSNSSVGDINAYTEKICEAFILLFRVFIIWGCSPESLFRVYSVSNYINLERLKQ